MNVAGQASPIWLESRIDPAGCRSGIPVLEGEILHRRGPDFTPLDCTRGANYASLATGSDSAADAAVELSWSLMR
jgi:hypothetical protein